MTPERAAAPRAVLLGACAAVLGVAVHGEAGGAVAPALPTLAVAVLVVLGTALLGARPGPPARTVALLAVGQLALHLSLPADAAEHDHHATDTAHGPGMVLAHLAVAALVGGALARADRALARAARERWTTLRRTWRALLTDVPVTGGPVPLLARPAPAAPGPTARAAVGHHPRRGPPSPR
ncbi:hypothetical protein ACQPX6_04015 [Actinomycetospora sp. CA-101289]|uniref:hypothetical protein n=1 Tax=Actinomycetospora sp. CA-101289 TaxID=3239893 RepID=UPI003D99E6D6